MLELALLVVACGLATYLWRGLGMLVSGRVNIESEFFVWAGCVAYALIAGLAVRILLLPTGTLAATPLPERLIACAIALVVYFVFAGIFSSALQRASLRLSRCSQYAAGSRLTRALLKIVASDPKSALEALHQ